MKRDWLYYIGAPVGSGSVVQTIARCSDPNIICDTKTTQPGEPQDVFLKVKKMWENQEVWSIQEVRE